MAISVVQWATGTVGVHAAPAIAAHPDLDLVGVWVHSDAKAGRDAGEICGTDPIGVVATQDRDALLGLGSDCVCYTAHSDLRPGEVVDDICTMLEDGHNVVNTSFVPLLHPRTAGFHDRLEAACQAGGTSFYSSGIDPGYGNATLAISAMALCKEVRTVRMMEIVNYDTWDNAATMFGIMGFAQPDTSGSLLLSPGSTALAWGPVIGLVAEALDVELDDITEWHEVIHTDEDFSIASGAIPEGTISGMHFEIRGMIGGEARIIVEHVTRLRDQDAPDWPQGEGYRILIEGEPSLKLEVELSSAHGDHNHAGCLATAMHVINAIPHVVAADPGVLTTLDLPNYSARHLMTP
jgi:4-hydroxy-tetrahydrodipicolinate reductase